MQVSKVLEGKSEAYKKGFKLGYDASGISEADYKRNVRTYAEGDWRFGLGFQDGYKYAKGECCVD